MDMKSFSATQLGPGFPFCWVGGAGRRNQSASPGPVDRPFLPVTARTGSELHVICLSRGLSLHPAPPNAVFKPRGGPAPGVPLGLQDGRHEPHRDKKLCSLAGVPSGVARGKSDAVALPFARVDHGEALPVLREA